MTDIDIAEGEELFIDYRVENTGIGSDIQDVILMRYDPDDAGDPGSEEDRDQDVQLGSAESTEGSLYWQTADDGSHLGEWTLSVETEDTTDSILVGVDEEVDGTVGTVQVIDSYEHADLGQYYGGAPSSFTVDSAFATHGSVGVRMNDGTTGGPAIRSYPGDGLDYYPERGDVIAWDFSASHDRSAVSNTLDLMANFGQQDTNNWYRAIVHWNTGDIRLIKSENGNSTTEILESDVVSYQASDTYTLFVYWDDGTLGGDVGDIHMEVYNQTQEITEVTSQTINDTTFSSGGIGVRIIVDNSDNAIYQDYHRITNA